MPTRNFAYFQTAKAPRKAINLKYSKFTAVQRRFLKENTQNYFGHEAIYVGPPYLKEVKSGAKVFSNPCISQEQTVAWDGKFGMTSDFFVRNDLQKLVLPTLQNTGIGLRGELLQLSEEEMTLQLRRSNNESYTKDPVNTYLTYILENQTLFHIFF